MESSSRAVVVFDRYTGPVAEDIAKFVEAIVAALKEDSDVLSLCLDGAARTRGGRSHSGLSVARGVRAAVHAFQPDLVIYVPITEADAIDVLSWVCVAKIRRRGEPCDGCSCPF